MSVRPIIHWIYKIFFSRSGKMATEKGAVKAIL